MNILFLTSRFLYPPDRGDKVRPWNFARCLAGQHNLFSLSLAERHVEPERLQEVGKLFDKVEYVILPTWRAKVQMAAYYASLRPLKLGAVWSGKMRRLVRRRLEDWRIDLVYAFPYRMGGYVRQSKGVFRVLDYCDAESVIMHRWMHCQSLALRPIIYWEWLKMRRWEARAGADFDESWLISSEDLGALGNGANGRAVVVPNGVDTDYFRPKRTANGEKDLLFVGYMGPESVDAVEYFYRRVYPAVRAVEPEARLDVVGANPPARLKALAKQDQSVTVTGFVQDLREYYGRAALLVAPMRFVAGVQNKVLEAMAMEVPAVATSYANEGINATPGEEIVIADDPEAFASAVVSLLQSPEARRRIGRRARRFVHSNFSWAAAKQRIDVIGEQVGTSRHSVWGPSGHSF